METPRQKNKSAQPRGAGFSRLARVENGAMAHALLCRREITLGGAGCVALWHLCGILTERGIRFPGLLAAVQLEAGVRACPPVGLGQKGMRRIAEPAEPGPLVPQRKA